MTTTAARLRASEASATLTQALVDAAAAGIRPRCGDAEVSWMFLDENPRHRATAATYCNGCILTEPCREVGRHQTFGVFGGVDVTRTPGRKKVA
jgi:Transcription factor WhiB